MRAEHLRDHGYAFLARRNFALATALRLRHVANEIIGKRLASSTLPELNGELWLATQIAGEIRTALDVGANVGDWSAFALSACPNLTRLVAYEPGVIVSALETRLGHDARAAVVNAAVSDEPGSISFFDEPSDSKLSTALEASNRPARTVACVRIDDELTARGIEHVDFLKVDVEGLDFHVLRGAERALREERIDIVQFEYGPLWQQAGSTLSAAVRMLEGHGYTVLLLTPGALRIFPAETVPELFTYANFVALRPSVLDRVRTHIQPGW